MKGPICALGSGDADHREKVTTKAHPPQLLSPRPSGGLDGWAVEGGVFMENQGVVQRMSSLWPGLGSKESTL